eukprot:1158940-Pelagomonas_calceolata.AAC.1
MPSRWRAAKRPSSPCSTQPDGTWSAQCAIFKLVELRSAPGNLELSVVGDFEPAELEHNVLRFVGSLPPLPPQEVAGWVEARPRELTGGRKGAHSRLQAGQRQD